MAAWVAKRASSDPSVASRILLGKKLISSTPFLGAPPIVHTIACSAERGYHDGCVPVHEARILPPFSPYYMLPGLPPCISRVLSRRLTRAICYTGQYAEFNART